METASDLAARLSIASERRAWSVESRLVWPKHLDSTRWCMPPELCSLYGTPLWEALDEPRRRQLSLYEMGNFCSLVLHGERPLVAGLVERADARDNPHALRGYLRHFADEEVKHMQMFGEFCRRYVGKIYPEKKLVLAREHASGEEDVAFFCKVMVVEEYGDFYNVEIERDERVDATVREMNRAHHADEARHLAFGRRHLVELFEGAAPRWSREALERFQAWLAQYMKAAWGDYYNPRMYEDAGISNGYAARQVGLTHPACEAHRMRASRRLVDFFLRHGLLAEGPRL